LVVDLSYLLISALNVFSQIMIRLLHFSTRINERDRNISMANPRINKTGFLVMLFLLMIFQLATSVNCVAQSTLLALSKSDHTLAIVDPASLKVIGKAPVGQDPHEVIASADGKTAYVSNYGGGRFHELNVIDLVNQKALPTIDTRPLFGPHGLVFVAGKVWFSAEGSKAVGSYDPAIAKLDWSMGTGQNRTHMIYVTNDAKKIYTTNVDAGTVSFLEFATLPPPVSPTGQAVQNMPARMDWIQTVIPVSKGCEGFDVSPDGRELWTVSAQDGTIFIIDTSARKVTATIDAKAFGANRLKFTTDGKRVLISSLRDGHLLIYDVASRKEIKRVEIGHGAAGILLEPGGKRAFVACTPDNYVAVVDLKSFEVTAHIDVGGGPDGLAWAGK
jgi:YVTN family beta-propeller protein